eukprot:210021_1
MTNNKHRRNQQYMLGQFYISPKYTNLKHELSNNSICCISLLQWDNVLEKARQHITTSLYKAAICKIPEPEIYYQIAYESCMTISHIVAVMVYCNQDVLQRKFSATYRRMSAESVHKMIDRHRNFAHLGRLLRECVECFTIIQWPWLLKRSLFHGITNQTTFSSMKACIKGPFSTTTEYTVAVTFCGNTGLILELNVDNYWMVPVSDRTLTPVFDCSFVSDFPNEKELLFIGGYGHFTFQTIVTPSGCNYIHYVRALTTISSLCRGYKSKSGLVNTDTNTQMCFRILSHQLHVMFPKNKEYVEFKSLPNYAKKLVKSHFDNITKIDLLAFEQKNFPIIHKLFKKFFFDENGWIKLDVITSLFSSLIEIDFIEQQTNEKFFQHKWIYESILCLLEKPNISLKQLKIKIPSHEYVIAAVRKMIESFKTQFAKFDWVIYLRFDREFMYYDYRFLGASNCWICFDSIHKDIHVNRLRIYTQITGKVYDIKQLIYWLYQDALEVYTSEIADSKISVADENTETQFLYNSDKTVIDNNMILVYGYVRNHIAHHNVDIVAIVAAFYGKIYYINGKPPIMEKRDYVVELLGPMQLLGVNIWDLRYITDCTSKFAKQNIMPSSEIIQIDNKFIKNNNITKEYFVQLWSKVTANGGYIVFRTKKSMYQHGTHLLFDVMLTENENRICQDTMTYGPMQKYYDRFPYETCNRYSLWLVFKAIFKARNVDILDVLANKQCLGGRMGVSILLFVEDGINCNKNQIAEINFLMNLYLGFDCEVTLSYVMDGLKGQRINTSWSNISPTYWESNTKSLSQLIYKVRGKDKGRAAWYYVIVDVDKLTEFVAALNDPQIHLPKYGMILASGYGTEPPSVVTNKFKRLWL